MDELKWLEQWFARQCNREWEQTRGASITTLDNPGWLVTIDLSGTSLEKRASAAVLAVDGEPPSAENGNVGGASWLKCELRDSKFVGAGDPHRLREIIACFRAWAESQ